MNTLTISGAAFEWETVGTVTCVGTLAVQEDYLVFTWSADPPVDGCGGTDHVQWTLDDGKLQMVDLQSVPGAAAAAVWSLVPWQRIE